MGIEYAQLSNQAALSAFENSVTDYEFSVRELAKAISLDKNDGIYYANMGLMEYTEGNYIQAYKGFTKAKEVEEDFSMPVQYLPIYANSCHEAYIVGEAKISLPTIKSIFEEALTIPENNIQWISKDDLNDSYRNVLELMEQLKDAE